MSLPPDLHCLLLHPILSNASGSCTVSCWGPQLQLHGRATLQLSLRMHMHICLAIVGAATSIMAPLSSTVAAAAGSPCGSHCCVHGG
jgi:hypothetical protein